MLFESPSDISSHFHPLYGHISNLPLCPDSSCRQCPTNRISSRRLGIPPSGGLGDPPPPSSIHCLGHTAGVLSCFEVPRPPLDRVCSDGTPTDDDNDCPICSKCESILLAICKNYFCTNNNYYCSITSGFYYIIPSSSMLYALSMCNVKKVWEQGRA